MAPNGMPHTMSMKSLGVFHTSEIFYKLYSCAFSYPHRVVDKHSWGSVLGRSCTNLGGTIFVPHVGAFCKQAAAELKLHVRR